MANKVAFVSTKKDSQHQRPHDTQHNAIQHNNIQRNNSQHKSIHYNNILNYNIQHNNIQHSKKLNVTLNRMAECC